MEIWVTVKTRRELFERDLHVTQSRQPVVAINTELASSLVGQ